MPWGINELSYDLTLRDSNPEVPVDTTSWDHTGVKNTLYAWEISSVRPQWTLRPGVHTAWKLVSVAPVDTTSWGSCSVE